MQTASLIPYPAPKLPAIEITGTVSRQNNILSIRYKVHGDAVNILLPTPATPTRQHDLWKATCFEFFIAIQDQPQYWEFNMSPSGDWNVYAMDAYRQVNMREESAFTQLPFEFKKSNAKLTLALSVDLHSILQANAVLQFGITTIIQTTNGDETYWALAHPGAIADFHLRESFIISV